MRLPALLFSILFLASALYAQNQPSSQPGPNAILDSRSPWRVLIGFMSEPVRRKSGELQFVTVTKNKIIPAEGTFSIKPKPAQEWISPDFNDSDWAVAHPPLFSRGVNSLALICLRCTFKVDDPASMKGKQLELTTVYRGGIIVYLNGKEAGRVHLPEGNITPETPAEDYPEEAYVTPNGDQLLWVGFKHPGLYKDRFALRNREKKISIPGSALQKGINVLALEIHRAPASELYHTARHKHDRKYSQWDRVSLESIALTSSAPGPIPNIATPSELKVWNWPLYSGLHTIDFGDPYQTLNPITISGTRNGVFSGQVVVSSSEPIKELSAQISDLKQTGGAVLPSGHIQIRYPYPNEGPEQPVISRSGVFRPSWPHLEKGVKRFDMLNEKPLPEIPVYKPAKAALQPVWISVNVPSDAKSGDYSGILTIKTGGKECAKVPVALTVADWQLPDSKDFSTLVGLVQSPDSVALHYGVPMWSDKHWELLDEIFRLLGQVGTKDIYITARAKTFYGNEHSMIRWIKKDDGTWDHDFSIAEKYIDLAVKHLGKVPIVAVYSWDVDAGSTYFGHAVGHKYAHRIEDKGTPFTVKDPKTGQLSTAVSPKWNDEGAVQFWKPVYNGIRKILAKHGMEKSLMVSLCPDKRPEPHVVKALKEASGGAPWISHAHPMTTSIHGEPVGYVTVVWAAHGPAPLSQKRYYGWKNPLLGGFPRMATFECGWGLKYVNNFTTYRKALEKSLISGRAGIGRCGADFWPVIKDSRGGKTSILGRYKTGSWHGGNILNSNSYILIPGQDKPVPTIRFEMLRLGAQEAEARIYIEKILTDPARKAKLGEKAAEFQKILDERFSRACGIQNYAATPSGGYLFARASETEEVTEYTKFLFNAAAEAAALLAK